MKIEELGRRWKQKDSAYSHLTDKEAGVTLVQKYPQYSQKLDSQELVLYNFGPSANTEIVPTSLSVSDLPKVIREIEHNLEVARGSFAVLFPSRRADYITNQIRHKIEQYRRAHEMAVQEFAHHQLPRHLAEQEVAARLLHASLVQSQQLILESQRLAHEVSVAQNEASIAIADAARREGLDVVTYSVQHQEREKTRLRIEEREETERIAFEYKQKELEEEVKSTLRLGNTADLTRAQQIEVLIDYVKRMESAASSHERQVYQREVNHLTKILYGEQSGMASEENAWEDPEGGASPPESESHPRTP